MITINSRPPFPYVLFLSLLLPTLSLSFCLSIPKAVADDEPDSVHAAGLTPPTKEQPPKPYDFDPSLGVDAGEGIETDL